MRKIPVVLPTGYEIRFANYNDISNVMLFFKKHWKEDHILANDRSFFEYEFCSDDEVNVVLLLDNEKEIKGTLGYIPYGKVNRDIFTVMWKVIDNSDLFLGTALFQYLIENGRCRHIYTSGLNQGTVNIYKYLGLEVVSLCQYYMINPFEKQKLAQVRSIVGEDVTRVRTEEMWQECNKGDFLSGYSVILQEDRIQKSMEYIIHRYYDNPKYQYRIYGLRKKGKAFFIVLRIQECNGSRALRVIDYFGDEFLTEAVSDIVWQVMCRYKCEYADMYAYGLDSTALNAAGFHMITDVSEDIIPNYFFPFVLENIKILAMYEKGMHPWIFKGDGDQDRAS